MLLARENLLYTYIENKIFKFGREPSIKELKRIATIISWNLWQMDGITFTVPLCDLRGWYRQLSLFDSFENLHSDKEPKYCRIKDWRSKVIVEYKSLVKELMDSLFTPSFEYKLIYIFEIWMKPIRDY